MLKLVPSCPAARCPHSSPTARATRSHTCELPQGDFIITIKLVFICISDAVSRLGLPPHMGHNPAPPAPKLQPSAVSWHPHRDTAKDWTRATVPMVPPLSWSPERRNRLSYNWYWPLQKQCKNCGPTAPARRPPAGPSQCCPPGLPGPARATNACLPSAELVHCKAPVNTGWG